MSSLCLPVISTLDKVLENKRFFFRGKFGKEEHFVGEWQEECQLF